MRSTCVTVLRSHPRSWPTRMVLTTGSRKRRPFLDATNEEDRVVVEGLWEGVQAPLAEPGPLSWLEKENLDFLRYILRMVTA